MRNVIIWRSFIKNQVGKWRRNDDNMTSLRRIDISTTSLRRIDVSTPSLRRYVPVVSLAPLAPQIFLTLAPNILNLPTPMELPWLLQSSERTV